MVRIVLDSSCDLPEDIRQKYGILSVPLQVTIGEESFRDWVELHPDELFHRIATENIAPVTSQPIPGDWMEVFEGCRNRGEEVLVITIPDALSGTYQGAVLARQEFPDLKMEIISATTASIGVPLILDTMGDTILSGASLEELAETYRELDARVRTYVIVGDMTMLKRGGRVSGSTALIGNVLNIKPILVLTKEGKLEAFDKVRGFRKAVARIREMFEKEGDPSMPAAVIDAKNPHEGDALAEALREAAPELRIIRSVVGSVIGSHVGPGTFATAYFAR